MNGRKIFGIGGMVVGILYLLIMIFLKYDSRNYEARGVYLLVGIVVITCGYLLYRMSKKEKSSKAIFYLLIIIEILFLFPMILFLDDQDVLKEIIFDFLFGSIEIISSLTKWINVS